MLHLSREHSFGNQQNFDHNSFGMLPHCYILQVLQKYLRPEQSWNILNNLLGRNNKRCKFREFDSLRGLLL
jgi:hypothetical protein